MSVPAHHKYNCSFCNAEVKELYQVDEEGKGRCGVCVNTVPHGWGDDKLGEWHVRGNGVLVLLAAINYGTNAVLHDVAELKAKITILEGLAFGASSVHIEQGNQLVELTHRAAVLAEATTAANAAATPANHRAREALAGEWIRLHEAEAWKLNGHTKDGVYYDVPLRLTAHNLPVHVAYTTKVRSWTMVRYDLAE